MVNLAGEAVWWHPFLTLIPVINFQIMGRGLPGTCFHMLSQA
jgi:hypothetical protein